MNQLENMKITAADSDSKIRVKICQRLADFADKIIESIFMLLMIGILGCCLFFYNETYITSWRGDNYIPAFLLIPIGGVFLTGVWSLIAKTGQRFSGCKGENSNRYLKYAALILFALQIYSVKCYFFRTSWDVETIRVLAYNMAHGEDVSWASGYFSMYPNNICLVTFFCFTEKLVHLVGLHSMEYEALLVISCMISSITGILVFCILKHLTKYNGPAWFGYVIYHLLVGMSPWVSIPYSDSFGLIFPVLILYLYLIRKHSCHKAVIWGLIGAIAVIGYQIKPQIVLMFIAIVLIKAVGLIRDRKCNSKAVIGVILGIALMEMLCSAVIARFPVEINSESRYGAAHFFMMGLNQDRDGVWAAEDVDFSYSFSTAAERDRADINRAVLRIQDMGISGLLTHGIRKTLVNFYDGTFAWAVESSFFREVYDSSKMPLSKLFHDLYYTPDDTENGKYHWIWSNFEQMLWMSVLTLSVFSILWRKEENVRVIMLAIVGLIMFELLFEARARYLYIYVPVYVILASCGFSALNQRKSC